MWAEIILLKKFSGMRMSEAAGILILDFYLK